MKLSQLIACEKTLANLEIKGITDDSRKVKQGFLFVDTQNNSAYLKNAIENGAGVIVTSNDCDFENTIKVENTRKAYAKIASNWFGNPSKDLILLGVTGTNGKTSVTYMVKSILELLKIYLMRDGMRVLVMKHKKSFIRQSKHLDG